MLTDRLHRLHQQRDQQHGDHKGAHLDIDGKPLRLTPHKLACPDAKLERRGRRQPGGHWMARIATTVANRRAVSACPIARMMTAHVAAVPPSGRYSRQASCLRRFFLFTRARRGLVRGVNG